MKRWLTASASLAALVLVPSAFADGYVPAQLLDASRITIQGKHVAGGCQYEGAVIVGPGQPAVEQHELSADPVTCTMVMEQGTPLGSGVDEARENVVSITGGTKARAARRPARTLSAVSATRHSAGYSKTWLTDPCPVPCIVVNSVQNSIDWYWDGTYLTPGSTVICGWAYEWFTFWGLKENNHLCRFNSPSYPQTWIDSTSYVHYKNGVFCSFTDTDVYYDRNHAFGYGNGNLVGQWSVTKSGACSGLLTVRNRTQRTMD